ncbi:hypothetical protein RCL1_004844 [Eukaryota sp. TZLM3-RCL]
MILLLGSSFVGKTYLVQSLVAFCNRQASSFIFTSPTTGRETTTLSNSSASAQIVEIGSSLLPIWTNFVGNIVRFLLVYDPHNAKSVSCVISLFQTLTVLPNSSQFEILLVVNSFNTSFSDNEPPDLLKTIPVSSTFKSFACVNIKELKKINEWIFV